MSIPTPIVAPSISGIPIEDLTTSPIPGIPAFSDLTTPISSSFGPLTATVPAVATPAMSPGIEWARNLQAYEIDRLRLLANDGSSTMPGDATYMIDFVRYLANAIKRDRPDLYSISNYELAEEIAKLLKGNTTTPTTNPDYSSRINVAEIDLMSMRGEIAALKESMSNLREEINHKDKIWGSF